MAGSADWYVSVEQERFHGTVGEVCVWDGRTTVTFQKVTSVNLTH